MALCDREERQFLCVPKPSKVKIGILLEDNRTQADHSSNSDVNFSVNNQATTVCISLSLSEFIFVYEVHLYTPKNPPKPIELATAIEDTDRGGKTQKINGILGDTVMIVTQSSAKSLIIRNLYSEYLHSISGVVNITVFLAIYHYVLDFRETAIRTERQLFSGHIA